MMRRQWQKSSRNWNKKFDEQFLEKTNDEKKKYEEAIEESWLEKLEKLQGRWLAEFCTAVDQAASGYVIEAEDLPSKWRTVNFTWYHSAISEMEESFLFTEYLLEHCRSFTSTGETNKMAYELEYILNGKTSDKENLKSTVNSLLLMREGLNLFLHGRILSYHLRQRQRQLLLLVGLAYILPLS